MRNNVERAKELVPSIILTILSMIQALALELFWSKIEGSGFLWRGDLIAVIGWLQIAVVLIGVLLVWVFYVSFVLRFTWLPTLEDTLLPFLIGLLEFAMIDLMHPDFLGPWMLLLAAIYAITIGAVHVTMRRARRDPANQYFFSGVGPSSWRDYLVSCVFILVLVVLGLALWIIDSHAYFSIAVLLMALLGLFYQFYQAKRYWMHSLLPDESAQEVASRGDD